MNIVIYSKNNCPNCETAINAAFNLNATVIVKKIDESAEFYSQLLTEVPDARSVPQIFVNGSYVGGADKFINWINLTNGGTKIVL